MPYSRLSCLRANITLDAAFDQSYVVNIEFSVCANRTERERERGTVIGTGNTVCGRQAIKRKARDRICEKRKVPKRLLVGNGFLLFLN